MPTYMPYYCTCHAPLDVSATGQVDNSEDDTFLSVQARVIWPGWGTEKSLVGITRSL